MLGSDRPDRQLALMAREQRHRWNQLPQQAQDGADVERELLMLHDIQHMRKAPAGNPIGHQQQPILRRTIEAAHARKQRMAHAREPGHAPAQRFTKLRRVDQRLIKRQDFDWIVRLGTFSIEGVISSTKTVDEDGRRGDAGWGLRHTEDFRF